MSLSHKEIDRITEEDIKELISNAVRESKVIEYKQELKCNSDKDKKEFLYDITSFANTSGGDILFGITAKDGIPLSIYGLTDYIPDKEELKIEGMLQASVAPRIIGHKIESLKLKNGKFVLILRIPNSLSAPHMVTFKGVSKFYARTSAGKYPLDVNEIRASFLASDSLFDKIRNYKLDRISKILADETPKLLDKTKIAIHFIPIISFNKSFLVDIKLINSIDKTLLRPLTDFRGWDSNINFDGYHSFNSIDNERARCYLQIFRNGCIETLNTDMMFPKEKIIFGANFDKEIKEAIERAIKIFKKLNIPAPIVVGISLLNVKGYSISTEFCEGDMHPHAIDREHLIPAEFLIEDYCQNVVELMKPTMDSFWNACGYLESRILKMYLEQNK